MAMTSVTPITEAWRASCRHAPGHVQWVTTPLSVDCDINDVRTAGSPPLTHWAVIALKSIRHAPPPPTSEPATSEEPLAVAAAQRPVATESQSSKRLTSQGEKLQALTQLRLVVHPLPIRHPGYPGTYGVPSNQTSAFFREGRFLVNAPPLAWSYLHTHEHYVDEMALYINASARSLGLAEAGLSPALRVATKHPLGLHGLAKHEAASGARRVCHFKRASDLSERLPGTQEIDGVFYRESDGMRPLRNGARATVCGHRLSVAILKSAASMPQSGIAPVHTFFRLFAAVPGVFSSTCNDGGCYFWLGHWAYI